MPTFTMVNEDEALLGCVLVDRYHVSEIIGSGIAGTVFGVDHLAFRRHSAMKVLRPRYATAELVHRVFHNEGRTAWTVSHPCLTEVFDIGQLDDGTPFVVMERLEGETLATRIRRERLSVGAAVDVIMQVLSALDAIHQHDVLLRGLAPHNILLATRKGCRPIVKILDFGLARLAPIDTLGVEFDSVRLASAGEDPPSVATPFYFAPERLRGEHLVTRASDVFVSMVIFFEALAGRRPFEAPTFDGLLGQISAGKPPRISDLRPDVPPDLDNLMARALSADPHSRPLSARDLQEEIRAIFDAPRTRGSTQLRAVPVALPAPPRVEMMPAPPPASMVASSHVDSAAYTPRQPLSSETQPHDLEGMMYEEETRTDRSLAEITLEPLASPVNRMNQEASAESPYRTVPPPPGAGADASIDVVVDEDTGMHHQPATSPGSSIDDAIAEMMRGKGDGLRSPDEEETETLQLTPEFRARIEQMQRERAMSQQPTQTIDSRPPPTRRVGKPDT
jgi:serine/threonine-protein kinase